MGSSHYCEYVDAICPDSIYRSKFKCMFSQYRKRMLENAILLFFSISVPIQDLEDDSDKLDYICDDSASEPESSSSKKKSYSLDPDHKLLLRSARPLLQSRNAAVSLS